MFAYRGIVVARQLDELRAESAQRRLARIPASDDEAPRPAKPRRPWLPDVEDVVILPTLRNYPYPAR